MNQQQLERLGFCDEIRHKPSGMVFTVLTTGRDVKACSVVDIERPEDWEVIAEEDSSTGSFESNSRRASGSLARNAKPPFLDG